MEVRGISNVLSPFIIAAWWIFFVSSVAAEETLLSTVLTPGDNNQPLKPSALNRKGRSGYSDGRYGASRGLLDRLARYDQLPSKCGRCLDDRYPDGDRIDQYDRSNQDRYPNDDDRRQTHRPTYGNRYDSRPKDYDSQDDGNDRKNGLGKRNETRDEQDGDRKWNRKPYDDKDQDRRYNDDRTDDDRRNGGDKKYYDDRRGVDRDVNKNRYDERDRYRPDDYYDRFLRRDPYGYEDPHSRRRPYYETNPYDRFDEGYGGRYDGYYDDHRRRPVYEDRFSGYGDRGNGYDDRGYGTRGRYPADSFRPWDETYRGSSGFDEGGRGYYFASGRPDYGAAAAWGRPAAAPRDPYDRPDLGVGRWGSERGGERGGERGYARPGAAGSGWHSVGERAPAGPVAPAAWHSGRDQSPQGGGGGRGGYGQPSNFGQTGGYGPASGFGQTGGYGPTGTSGVPVGSTTPATSYLYQRENEQVTPKNGDEPTTTKLP